MIVGRGPKKEADRRHVLELGARVGSPDDEFVVLILARDKSQVRVDVRPVGLQLSCGHEFLLRFREFLLTQQSLAKPAVQLGIFRMRAEQCAIDRLRQIILSGTYIEVYNFALRVRVRGGQFQRRLEFRDGIVLLALCDQHAPQLKMNGGVIGALGGEST